MYKTTEKDLVISMHGINYYVIYNKNSESNRYYGILAESSDDSTDFQTAENLFFTHTEAEEYCRWFAENEVYPITLCEVLANIFHMPV